MYVQLVVSQLLMYESALVAVVADMDFTRTHKYIVVVVAADVDITRMHIYIYIYIYIVVVAVVVATVEIYQDTQICWCVMYHLEHIRYH